MIYQILLLAFKTIISISVVVLAILSAVNAKNYKEYLIYGWIIFGILSVLLIWLDPLLQRLSNHELKKTLKPVMDIIFTERNDQQLYVEITSNNSSGTQVNDLYFKFDVPGEFILSTEKHKEKIGNFSVSHSMLAAVGDPIVVIATTVYVHCSAIMPSGGLSLIIDYKPTGDLPIPGRELIKDQNYPTHYTPLMDLHDYSPVTYSWTFNGNAMIEKVWINLENLNYIKKDNDQLVKQLKWFPDLESVRKMELKRKNW